MSVRSDFADQLRADWAEIPALSGVTVVATERALDDVTKPTALVRQKTVARLPQAPLTSRNVGLLLTLISPLLDLDKAGDQLDDLIDATFAYLGPRFKHEEASAVGYGERLAYDIPVTVIATTTPLEG